MWNDIRVGVRLLRKNLAFTLTAALTLALCIGANTALFSVVHNVVLRPLPVPQSDRIVVIENLYPNAGAAENGGSGVPDYYDRLRETDVFDTLALYNTSNASIDQNGTPTRIRIMNVTPSFFRLVRVAPQMGRIFSEEEGEVGNEKKVVLSYGLWQTAFGGAPDVVGRDFRLDGQPYSIVGVMPRGFAFPDTQVMAWRPLAFTPEQKADDKRHSNNFQCVARLKPGATLQQGQAQIDAINARNLDRFPQYRELLINAGFHTRVMGLQEKLVRNIRPTLYLMWGGAVFVLLIGAVNVANLVLVRSRVRLKELATRLALGAGRGQIARQLVTESVLLTLASAAAGLVVGYGVLRVLGALNIEQIPRGSEIRMDGIVVAYTGLVALLLGVVIGLIPVANVLPANLTTVLREEGRSGTSGRGARTLRRSLVVAQVAFAFVLLVGAGLLFASFQRVLKIDPGFNPDHVLTASISLPRTRYKDDPALRGFAAETLRRLRALPGVKAVGATDTIPFGGSYNDSVILAEGYQMKPGESLISPEAVDVTPGYFEAMTTTLVKGRFFTDADNGAAPLVAIVDEKLANHFWPNQDPIGRRMYRPEDINNILAITPKTRFITVVGVIRDMKLHALVENMQPVGTYYFPMDQDTSRNMTFALKTASEPAALANAVRAAINSVDPELPVFGTQTMDERTEKSLVSRRSPMLLSLSFGAVALFLSAIGIYGVLAYLVTQRRKEIGIRLALGSSGGAVFQLVLREGMLLTAIGFALGAAGALALRRSLESQLFGISASDPLVLAMATAVLAAVAALACAVPARRAMSIDPVVVLTE
jgi:predicted permease